MARGCKVESRVEIEVHAGLQSVRVEPIAVADMLGLPGAETETTFVQDFLHEVWEMRPCLPAIKGLKPPMCSLRMAEA